MTLIVEDGLSRLARALRVLAKVWGWGVLVVVIALYLGLPSEFPDGEGAWQALVVGLLVAGIPAAGALGLARLLQGSLHRRSHSSLGFSRRRTLN
jgi:hypothetical protein